MMTRRREVVQMATTRPRITISLEPRQRELLGRLAKANRVPMSRTVVDLLEAVEPYLERAATLVERASQLRGKGIGRELVASLERAEQDVRPHIEAGLKHVDQAVADAEARAGSGRAHAQRATAPTRRRRQVALSQSPRMRPPHRERARARREADWS